MHELDADLVQYLRTATALRAAYRTGALAHLCSESSAWALCGEHIASLPLRSASVWCLTDAPEAPAGWCVLCTAEARELLNRNRQGG